MAAAEPHPRNNFDGLRIVAALMVVIGHAYVLSGREAAEPLAAHTGLGGFGEFGVSIFFVISGFLVAGSLRRLGAAVPYLAHRALRILPGLAVATALTAWVLGPLVTRLSPADYFAQAQTWTYVVRNVLLYPVTYLLPGVFEHTPYPLAVNGSLWTLRLEFTFYLVLPLLAWKGLLTRGVLAGLAGAAGLAYLALMAAGPAHVPPIALIAARTFYLFIAGSALFAWRDHGIVTSVWPLVAALVLIVAVAPFRALAPFVAPLVLPLAVIGLALRPAPGLSSAGRFGDLSYGLYIYAFPVQQAWMQALGPERLSVGAFLAVTLISIVPLAALSWWLVERPALRLKAWVGRGAEARPGSPLRPAAAEAPAGPPT